MFYSVENSSAGTTTYPITVNGQLLQYGKVVRGHKASIGSNDYLYTEGQQLLLEYEVCVPLDKPRVSGSRVFHNGFYFEIYSRHPVWLTYSVLEATVNKTVTNNYYVQ
ncbi:hypothetical protein [Caldicellulosiruptor changbaiensis]|uniref:hypothetical protein n=1 Tax=Caldicellulosiruptor changbaiensis TaxID=1222016 RepID=UPI001F494D4A|nr:hypothetical protein [Caldicellulosiruptor changbaiensis]